MNKLISNNGKLNIASLVIMIIFWGCLVSCNMNREDKMIALTNAEKKLCDSLFFDESIFRDINRYASSPIEPFHYSLGKMINDGIEEEFEPIRLQGIVFGVPTLQAYEIVLALKDRFKQKGYTIFLLERKYGIEDHAYILGVLRTTNKYSILRKVQTDGINYDITNDSLLQIIGRFDRKYSLELIGASGDYCEFVIHNPPKSWKEIAEEAYAVCPDIVDQGAGSLQALEAEMQKTQRLYFWWD